MNVIPRIMINGCAAVNFLLGISYEIFWNYVQNYINVN